MDTTTTFALDRALDTSGTHLLTILEGITEADLAGAFGGGNVFTYIDRDSGYDGPEWSFRASNGDVFNVYARWGTYRIGGRAAGSDFMASPTSAPDFRDWLLFTVQTRGK